MEQTAGRLVTQVGLTILCPMSAPYVCWGVKAAIGLAWSFTSLEIPSVLLQATASLPSSLDETLTSTLLMMAVYPALAAVDTWAESRAAKKQESIAKPTGKAL